MPSSNICIHVRQCHHDIKSLQSPQTPHNTVQEPRSSTYHVLWSRRTPRVGHSEELCEVRSAIGCIFRGRSCCCIWMRAETFTFFRCTHWNLPLGIGPTHYANLRNKINVCLIIMTHKYCYQDNGNQTTLWVGQSGGVFHHI